MGQMNRFRAVIASIDGLARHRRSVICALAVALACLSIVTGVSMRLDRLIDPLRAAAWIVPPSGRIVVVEMDARSVAAIHRWPWPRENHAAVIDQLCRAGAASITFDVDFSSRSTRAGDVAMAQALKRADGLVTLPTFAQQVKSGDARSIDSLPLPSFRPYVALASVSMQPDADGIVRRAPFGTVTAGTPRPSLSSLIAQRSGSADTFFPINFNIDPTRLPSLSFVAVRDGAFDPSLVRGRDVLIGATAIEMGDRYATPAWGVIPGVIVQGLAAETLLRGIPVQGTAAVTLALALLFAAPILRLRRPGMAAAAALSAPALLFGAALWAQLALHIVFPLAAGMVAIAVIASGRVLLHYTDRFEQQRSVDEETGLPNRRAMADDLASRAPAALVVATIGNYDALVAVLGEEAGQDLVRRIADRLRLHGGATVYRIAHRQLAFELVGGAADAGEDFAGLRTILTQPVEVAGRRTDAAVHLGVSEPAGTVQDRLVNASRAADDAVEAGVFWRRSSFDADALERRLSLMGELDQAILNGEIELHYQPKLSLQTNGITSVEALVRWRHPSRGMIRPDLFIPLAEQSDRIAPLTLFVLQRAMDDLAGWRSRGIDLAVAVNLSAVLLSEPKFNAAVSDLLAASPVPVDRLIFEVTESATLSDPEQAVQNLCNFRDKGVAVSMDDYGTGQSTLTYLRQLPLSELKIDRSFVQHVHVNRSDALMVRSTIDLAHDLGLKVVAEGIEDDECLAFLRAAGCDMAQGYLISRPLPGAELIEFLERRSLAA